MRKLLLKWIISAVTVLLVAWLYPGIHVANAFVALAVAFTLGCANSLLRPLLILLTLPINILSLGLFTFVINGFLLWLTAWVIPGFAVRGFFAAIISSILISLISVILGWVVDHD